MGILFALALAAATPAAPDANVGKPTLLVLSLETAGVSADEATILDGMIANALTAHDEVQVVTADELRQMIELEGEKQALGCDDTSCLGEIAGAMGAQYVLFGKAGRLGELFVVQVNLYDQAAAKAVTRQEIKDKELERVAEGIAPAVDAIVAHITGVPLPTPVASPLPEESGVSPLLLAGAGTAAVGGLTAGGGVVMLAVFVTQLGDAKSSRETKTTAAAAAPWMVVGAGVGATLLLAGAALAGVGLVME